MKPRAEVLDYAGKTVATISFGSDEEGNQWVNAVRITDVTVSPPSYVVLDEVEAKNLHRFLSHFFAPELTAYDILHEFVYRLAGEGEEGAIEVIRTVAQLDQQRKVE